MSRFTESSDLAYDVSKLQENEFIESQLVEVNPVTHPTASATSFQINYDNDMLASGYMVDVKNSYLQIEFNVHALSDSTYANTAPTTAGEMVFAECPAVSWMTNWRLAINGQQVDDVSQYPGEVLRCKSMFKSRDWLDTYGVLYGMLLNRQAEVNDAYTDYATLCENLTVAGRLVKFNLPLSELTEFFNWTPSQNGLFPLRSIQFSGTRQSSDASWMNLRLGTATAPTFVTLTSASVDSFRVRLQLNFVRPSIQDFAIMKSRMKKPWDVVYPRYQVNTKALGESTTAVELRIPVRSALTRYVTTSCTAHPHADDDVDNPYTRRLMYVGSVRANKAGVEKPYPQQMFSSTYVKQAEVDYTEIYKEYLRLFGANNKAIQPAVKYEEFIWCPIIPIKLDNKLVGTGIELNDSNDEIYTEITPATCTGDGTIYFTDEFASKVTVHPDGTISDKFNV